MADVRNLEAIDPMNPQYGTYQSPLNHGVVEDDIEKRKSPRIMDDPRNYGIADDPRNYALEEDA